MKKRIALLFLLGVTVALKAQISFETELLNTLSGASAPVSVVKSDINGNGYLDIIVTSYSDNQVVWYENTGGTYSIKTNIVGNISGARAIYVDDIDGDGDKDVVAAGEVANVGTMIWFENEDGLGNFAKRQTILEVYNVRSIIGGDLDLDGDIDIVTSTNGGILWHENLDGDGTFDIQETNISTGFFGDLGDLNGDGSLDIIITTSTEINWRANDGAGNFGAKEILATGSGFRRGMTLVDLDNDNDLDVVSCSLDGDGIVWFKNIDGQGTFALPIVIATDPATYSAANFAEIVGADMDNDGDIDVVYPSTENSVIWFENMDGQGTFMPSAKHVIFSDQNLSTPMTIDVGDIDNDNDEDLMIGLYDNDQILWYENTDGMGGDFSSAQLVNWDSGDSSLGGGPQFYDFDGDGDLDVIVTGLSTTQDPVGGLNVIFWYKNIDGQGTFEYAGMIETGVREIYAVFPVDLDSDGDSDIVYVTHDPLGPNYLSWSENLGNNSFASSVEIDSGANEYWTVIAADMDNDGDVDIIASDAEDERLIYYESIDGSGSFEQRRQIHHNDISQLFILDLDKDGDKDIFWGGGWLENTDGQGNFEYRNTPINYIARDITDINGDGDIDFLNGYSNTSSIGNLGRVRWNENIDGIGTFSPEKIIKDNLAINFVKGGDLDNDGDMDVVINHGSIISWFENLDGEGSFGIEQFIDYTGSNYRGFDIGDFNGDGLYDLLVYGSDIRVLKNVGIQSNKIFGNIKIDIDSNGCDSDDIIANNVLVENSDGVNSASSFSSYSGFYQFFMEEGSFTTRIVELPVFYTSEPITYTTSFTGTENVERLDFCIKPSSAVNDLNISIYPTDSEPRPGFDTSYRLIYNNVGTTNISGVITFEYDDTKMEFSGSSEPVTQNANILSFNFSDFNPFETKIIDVDFELFQPPTTNINDVIETKATINPTDGDFSEEDNTYVLKQTVVGSYDPNDIKVLEGEEISLDNIDKYLHYIIRFQNTGTASAINVEVEHILDDKLDWNTLKVQNMSHEGQVYINNGNDIRFKFTNIYLPDSISDEPNSHGYIAFKIKPKTNVRADDIIYGLANIYFDFNPPILTNTVSTRIVDESLGNNNYDLDEFLTYPNPANSKISIKGVAIIREVTLYDATGRRITSFDGLNDADVELDIQQLSKGIYFMEILTENTKSVRRIVKN